MDFVEIMAVLWGEYKVSTYQYILHADSAKSADNLMTLSYYNIACAITRSNAPIETVAGWLRKCVSRQYSCHGPPNGSPVNTNGMNQLIACHTGHSINPNSKTKTLLLPAGTLIQTSNASAVIGVLHEICRCDVADRFCILSSCRLLHYRIKICHLNWTPRYDTCRSYKLYYIHLVFGS
jgi:hypothetical protein